MPDEYADPSGNTEAFRAFAQSPDPAGKPAPSKLPVIIGSAVLAVLLIALAVWVFLG